MRETRSAGNMAAPATFVPACLVLPLLVGVTYSDPTAQPTDQRRNRPFSTYWGTPSRPQIVHWRKFVRLAVQQPLPFLDQHTIAVPSAHARGSCIDQTSTNDERDSTNVLERPGRYPPPRRQQAA
uniref:Secreted protein n=1 Tax=Mycena chlorophos TaxID=658473 RepID=A0ABQ0LWD5_MYCCL|nr:predicted protein [Mycena chlorophos]